MLILLSLNGAVGADGGHEIDDGSGALHSRALLDATRHVDPEGIHVRNRRGDVRRAETPSQHQLSGACKRARGAPVAQLAAAAPRSLVENSRRKRRGYRAPRAHDSEGPE